MLTRKGVAIAFYVQFIAAKAGKTGLSPLVDVYKCPTGGAPSQVVTDGAAAAVGNGVYRYELAAASVDASGEYIAVFKTADSSVDQQHLAAIWCTDKRVNAQVQACDADAINAASVAADAVAEIQAGLATAAALTAIGNRLPAALVGGRMDASVGAMAGDVLTAAALAADAVAEIQAGLATSAGLGAVGAAVTSISGRIPAALVGGAMPSLVMDYAPGAEPPSPADIWSAGDRTLTAFGFQVVLATPPPTTAEIADRILGRSIAGGADGGRMVRDALRALRNRVSRPDTTGIGTVYQEDDATPAWTFTLTTSNTAAPAKEMDPS